MLENIGLQIFTIFLLVQAEKPPNFTSPEIGGCYYIPPAWCHRWILCLFIWRTYQRPGYISANVNVGSILVLKLPLKLYWFNKRDEKNYYYIDIDRHTQLLTGRKRMMTIWLCSRGAHVQTNRQVLRTHKERVDLIWCVFSFSFLYDFFLLSKGRGIDLS